MSADLSLQRLGERGWHQGLSNVLSRENNSWWRTRRWLVQLAIWLLVINGLIAIMLWLPAPSGATQTGNMVLSGANPLGTASIIFVILGVVATGVGGSLVMQGVILDEKKSGTMAWIL